MRIDDISDTADPVLINTYNTPGIARPVYVADNIACVADGYTGECVFIDITGPYYPVPLGTITLPGTANDICFGGEFAYAAAGDLFRIDMSDPLTPTLAQTCITPSSARSIYMNGDFIYVADGSSLIIYEIFSETSIDDNPELLPSQYGLAQNYPNPFNASTIIEYSLAKQSVVVLALYDILGRKVLSTTLGNQAAGGHIFTWNAADQVQGVYFYSVKTDEFEHSRRMVLLK